MSAVKRIKYEELPEKPWKDYSSDEIRRYCLRNSNRCDCSFIVEHKEGKKVYKSFKWILEDISPVLRRILNDKKNQAKNSQEIVVSNANHIEAILFYGHMKVIDTKVKNLVDFYGASKEYRVKDLEDEVIELFNYDKNQKKASWVKLFWLSYIKYPEDQQMRSILEMFDWHDCDEFFEPNYDFILEFEKDEFDIFFNIVLSRRVHKFDIFLAAESYFLVHIFDEDENKKLEDIDTIGRNYVEWCISKLDVEEFDLEDYKNGPLESNLLTAKLKIEHLKIIQERFHGYESSYKEIELCLQKLYEAESK